MLDALHIRYLRWLEDSPRVRAACVAYLQNWLPLCYPIRPDLVKQAEELAARLGGKHIRHSFLEGRIIRRRFWKATDETSPSGSSARKVVAVRMVGQDALSTRCAE